MFRHFFGNSDNVLYYGEKEWDGPENLHDMLNFNGIPEKLRSKFANYPMILIDVPRFSEWERFRTDLREVFGFIYHSGSDMGMENFIDENRDKLAEMKPDACEFVEAVTGSKELGRIRTEKEGIKEGIRVLTLFMQTEGYSVERVIEFVTENCGLSPEDAEECIRAGWGTLCSGENDQSYVKMLEI